jgi:hypothetical protein
MSVAESPRTPSPSPPFPTAGGAIDADHVRRRLQSVRGAVLRQRAVVDVGRGLLLLVVLLATLSVLDYRFELSTSLRIVGLLAAAGSLAWFAVISSRQRYQYSEREAAADVEAHFPQYGQRIRTSRDYGDPDRRATPASPGMVALLREDTQLYTQDVDFKKVVRPRPVVLAGLSVGAALLVCLACLLTTPELWTSLGRALLLPLQYSQVTVTPVEGPVLAGDSPTVKVLVTGRPVKEANLLVREMGSEKPWTALALLPLAEEEQAEEAAADEADSRGLAIPAADGGDVSENPRPVSLVGPLGATLADCRQSLEYKVVAGPLDSQVWPLVVLQPLEMQQFEANIESPAYTRRPPETTDSMDLKVIEGARVRMQLTMNRPPAQALLTPLDKEGQPLADQERPLAVEDCLLSVGLDDLRQSATYRITAEAADGIRFESPRIRIQVQPDAKPHVRFVKPPEELEVTPTTEVTLAVEAGDDFGVRRVGVACKVADGPLRTMWSQDFDQDPPSEFQMQPVLYLEDFTLTHQDSVTYYAFVEDNHPDGPRRTMTELRFIDIRPFKREYQILPASGGT